MVQERTNSKPDSAGSCTSKDTSNSDSDNELIHSRNKFGAPKTLILGSAKFSLDTNNDTAKEPPRTASTFQTFLESASSKNKNSAFTIGNVINQYSDLNSSKEIKSPGIFYPGQGSSQYQSHENLYGESKDQDNKMKEEKEECLAPARENSAQVSRNSSVRFSAHPVIIRAGQKDPQAKRNESFSKKSILKDNTSSSQVPSNDLINIISKTTGSSNSTPYFNATEKYENHNNTVVNTGQTETDESTDLYLQKALEVEHENLELYINNNIESSEGTAEKVSSDNEKLSLLEESLNSFGTDPKSSTGDISENSITESYKNDTLQLEKKKQVTIHIIFMWIALTLFLATIAITIPLLIIFSRGTETTVLNYFTHSSDVSKNETLNIILDRFYNVSMERIFADYSNKKVLDKTPSEPKNNTVTLPQLKVKNGTLNHYHNDTDVIKHLYRKDLKQTFEGLNYTPKNAIDKYCNIVPKDVLLDLLTISHVTKKIRIKSLECEQAQVILKAIQTFKLDLKVSIGVAITGDKYFNDKQIKELKHIISEYPENLIDNIFIGNEVLYRNHLTEEELLIYIRDVKAYIKKKEKNIPVGTAEYGLSLAKAVVNECEILGVNMYPFFTGQIVQNSTDWIYDFKKYTIGKLLENNNNTTVIFSEVGWPYRGGTYKKAVSGPKHYQRFMNDFVCHSKKESQVPYYYVEAFDDSRKKIYYHDDSKQKTEWALFDDNRNLKEGLHLVSC